MINGYVTTKLGEKEEGESFIINKNGNGMEKDKEEFWDTLKNPPPKKTAADYLREIKKRHDKYIEIKKEEEDKNA